MRWYTCTPVPFEGNKGFFARDSGLLCRGFQQLGVTSRAIMPGPAQPDDEPDLIRTDYPNLESPVWWRSLGIDGLVLYAWGSPRYLKVASAIREAGISLVLNQDSCGLFDPRCEYSNWIREILNRAGAGRVKGGWRRALFQILHNFTLGLWFTQPGRARHLQQGHRITCVSPIAAERYRHWSLHRGGAELAKRVTFVPHPVHPSYHFSGTAKTRRVIAVGRWDDEIQKRTTLLRQVIERLLECDPDVRFDIVGRPDTHFPKWLEALAPERRSRIILHGVIPPDSLPPLLQQAQVIYCSSAHESFHIASAEALCCGATVVSSRSPSLPSFEWFVGDGDGRLAATDEAEGHVAALAGELAAWRGGERDPGDISARWIQRVHADRVADRILRLFPDPLSPDSAFSGNPLSSS